MKQQILTLKNYWGETFEEQFIFLEKEADIKELLKLLKRDKQEFYKSEISENFKLDLKNHFGLITRHATNSGLTLIYFWQKEQIKNFVEERLRKSNFFTGLEDQYKRKRAVEIYNFNKKQYQKILNF